MQPVRSAISSLSDFDIRDLTDSDVRLRVHRNEAPLPPPQHVVDAVRFLDAESFRRYPLGLMRRFTKGLALRLDVPSNRLVIGSGADDLLMAAARVATDPGDNSVMVRPTFGMYARAALAAGAIVRELRYRERWKLDTSELLQLMDNRTKLLYLGHPNNPTGEPLAVGTLQTLADALPQALIVVDEVYLCFREASLVRSAGSFPNVVVVGSLSKVSALAGMRIGFAVATPSVARILRKVIAPYPLSVASLAAADALIRGDAATTRFEDSLDTQIRRSLDAIVDAVAPFARAIWRGPANFILVDFAFDAKKLAKRLRRRGVAVRIFSDPDLAGCVRLCALDDQSTSELIRVLGEILPQFLEGIAVDA